MKEGPCDNCDEACKNPYNDDEECLGSLTEEEREAVIQAIIKSQDETRRR
jgi:hypothetical protein